MQFNKKYYYEVGIGNTTRQFWFITPPWVGPDLPYTYGVNGKCYSFGCHIPKAVLWLRVRTCLSRFSLTNTTFVLEQGILDKVMIRTGDLGQIYDSNRTLTHYESNPPKGQTWKCLIFPCIICRVLLIGMTVNAGRTGAI